MKWFLVLVWGCWLVVVALVIFAFADHSALRTDEFNQNPINTSGQPGAGVGTQLREFLEHEIPQRRGRIEGS